ncbi:MAG: cyclic nucleotide-binding domain-containing protein [Actinobacteria bacterium]|nr:cyclic nucleotide-binding domain-containing protein [Actinomycetota bacterium]
MQDSAELLAQVPLFAPAEPELLCRLAASSFPRRLARGQVLFVEGEPCEHLYVVVSGRLSISVTSTRGDELVLSVLGPGDALGELGVVDGGTRSAGATAVDEVQLLAVPAAAVRQLMASSPPVALAAAEAQVAARLGAGRQALNRALSRFADRGWVEVRRSAVVVLDRAALQRFAGS